LGTLFIMEASAKSAKYFGLMGGVLTLPRHKIGRLEGGIVSATTFLDASTNYSFGRDATDGTANSVG